MKRIVITGIITLLLTSSLKAWNITQASGGRTNSLGKCSVALSDFWSAINNPAGFANQSYPSFGFYYENRFLLKELSTSETAIIMPSILGNIAMSYSRFGFDNYNENIFGIGLARKFGPNISVGLKLYYIFFKISGEYENLSIPTFDIGIQYKINESLCLGVYIFNPINMKVKSLNKDKTPVIMRFGISHQIIDNFMITSEVETDTSEEFIFRAGIEYEAYKNIFIRSGFQYNPNLFTFGFGYKHKSYIVDVSSQMNQTLGASINCSLIFKIRERTKI